MTSLPTARPRVRKSSSVSSGRRTFLDGVDGSPWARRFRDLVTSHISDLGGPDAGLSEALLSLVRRAATLECELELMESKLSRGETIDLDVYQRAAGGLRRILESIGLERRAKPAKTLEQHLAWLNAQPDPIEAAE